MPPERKPAVPPSLIYLLRDVGVAFLIVAVVLGGIFAYTRVWPPMVVVESGSMAHSDTESSIGVIDTGDLVLVQQASLKSDITTYVEGRATGYGTYGNYGDVIIFLRDGQTDPTPIIHRPLVYLQCNLTFPGCPAYDVPGLAGLSRDYWDTTTHHWWNLGAGDYLQLFHVFDVAQGERTLNLSIQAYQNLARIRNAGVPYDGYITKGDHNAEADGGWLVRQDWVIGRARGELPWFGLIKLTLFPADTNRCRGWGDVTCAPANSWSSLTASLALLIAAPIAFDITTSLWARSKRKGGTPRKPGPARGNSGPGRRT